jgi:hypothetical protein
MIHPVVNPDDVRQIFSGNIPAIAPFFAGECERNMLQDILPVCLYPGYEIINNALLAPSPLLTAAAALGTGLV